MIVYGKFLFAITVFLTILFFDPSKTFAFEFTQEPQQIVIPSVDISLPVYLAKIQYNTWEVRTDGASFGEGSSLPGKNGNTVIFSHALPKLFGPLTKVKTGDAIHIFTTTDWFVFRVNEILEVNPEDTFVIFQSKGRQLTLYTCTGKQYEKRHVIRASLLASVY